jgi:hypothetical protein
MCSMQDIMVDGGIPNMATGHVFQIRSQNKTTCNNFKEHATPPGHAAFLACSSPGHSARPGHAAPPGHVATP